MTYPFLQGIDYGPRSGTLGISFHMSEGYDGLPTFLARHLGEDLHEWARRVNGVSCHAAILSTGRIVQMVDWGHACGNLNPDDRAGEYGYYGGHHLRDVLGAGWTDPNMWTVSAELAGFRAKGPTTAQVTASIQWGREMIARFPTIRGATGHHDQSPKECPGLTTNMKAIFEGLGGHGLWPEQREDEVRFVKVIDGKLLPVVAGDRWSYTDGTGGASFGTSQQIPVVGSIDARAGQYLCEITTGRPYDDGNRRDTLVLVRSTHALVDAPAEPPPVVSCDDVVTAELDRAAVRASEAVRSRT